MSNLIKSDEEIKIMKISGNICAGTLKKIIQNITPGIKCENLEQIAQKEITESGAKPFSTFYFYFR